MDTSKKIYFETAAERDAFNAAEAYYREMDMRTTVYWYPWGEDENGHYIIATDW